jgi:hypothetical protein
MRKKENGNKYQLNTYRTDVLEAMGAFMPCYNITKNITEVKENHSQ